MTTTRRLQIVCAVLALAALSTSNPVSGEPAKKGLDKPITAGSNTGAAKADNPFPEDLAGAKFGNEGVVTYQRKDDGEVHFAFQLKPKLEPLAQRPQDKLIMIDTSASQAGHPLMAAKLIAEEIIKQAKPDDRIAIWTVNVRSATRDLTKGFHKPSEKAVKDALKALQEEVPLGDTDLKDGLEKAAKAFDGGDRQQAIIFLGDGMSLHNPISNDDRVKLCEGLVKNKVALFPIPIGPHLDPNNLHGMASYTGGLVLRPQARDEARDLVKRLCETIAAPILYPSNFTLPKEVVEFYPTKLPPLRGDAPTLVVGRLKPGKDLTCDLEGAVAGKPVRLQVREPVLDAEVDNFFLVNMVAQWRNAKEQPALMRADRALAYAQQLNLLARDELLGQAQMALMLDHVDAAGKLFEQAKKLDPADLEAEGGLRLVGLLRDGKVTKDQIRKELKKDDGQAVLIKKGHGKERDAMKNLMAQADKAMDKVIDKAPAVAPAAVAPARDDDVLMKQQKLKQAVEEQHINEFVNDALRQANRMLRIDPEGANDLVKRALAAVRDNVDVRVDFKLGLINRLENAARNVAQEGVRVKRDQEERLKILAQNEARMTELTAQLTVEDRTRERMRVYRNLMNQARFEDAYAQGLDILQDAVKAGQAVPVAVTAATDIGLAAHNLREVQELRRVREERYLLVMMQVERSHVPFPDEPPIQFPTPAKWRQITNIRKDRYEASGLSDDDPVTLKKIKELKDKLLMPVTIDGFEPNTPLKEALGFLSERFEITMLIDTDAFKADLMIMEPENQPVKLPKMVKVSLGTVLRLLLAQASATFMIRRDYLEVTTPQRQAAEKTIRVYPVADLVTPIPNSVNQQAVNQTQQNAFAGAMGGSLMGMMGMGGMGMMGMGGLGLGGLGLGGMGLAGMGMGGMAMGMAGMAGMAGGAMQGAGGFGGINGFAGQGAQGIGAGGNLGGQFGLQGGDTSGLLLRLITQVVGKPEDWAPIDPAQLGGVGNAGNAGFAGGMMGNMGGFGGMGMGLPPVDPNEGAGNPNEAGSLGYYSPTRALIVKATSRVHTRLGGGLLGPKAPAAGAGAGAGGAAIDKPGRPDNAFVIAPGRKPVQVATNDNKKDDPKKGAAVDPKKKAAPLVPPDPKVIWQDALARGTTEPGLIIATADLLVERGQFQHAAEFLKANLRHGIVVKPWVYESLTLALKLSKGSAEDIERAQLSLVDVQPQDAQGYLRASQAMAEDKRWDRAVAYCRQASILDPSSPQPYADTLKYARQVKDTDAMEWAAANLLSRDWPVSNEDLHLKAEDGVKALRKVLEDEKRTASAEKLGAAVTQHRQRDLVIKLSWQGSADLDLEVKEPIGTVCSFLQRQTAGGGTLIGDNLTTLEETYVAAEAFPGQYEITLRQIWGKPLGSKATLVVVEHDGTKQQHELLRDTIVFDRTHTVKVTLKDGRRTSVAQVSSTPPPRKEDKLKPESDRALNQLRALADPDFVGSGSGVRGGMGTQVEPKLVPSERTTRPQATKAASLVSSGIEMTMQPVISADRRIVGMSLSPVFQTLGKTHTSPVVVNPIIPGGGR